MAFKCKSDLTRESYRFILMKLNGYLQCPKARGRIDVVVKVAAWHNARVQSQVLTGDLFGDFK